MRFEYKYLGLIPYQNSLQLMEEKISDAVQQKTGYIFALQHERVYTSGLKTSNEHILKDIPIIPARRGGSVTVHNPGQLVLYTVIPLDAIEKNLEKYIRLIEQTIIDLLKEYHIEAFLNEDHTGVWTNRGKIAFIGLAAKKGAVYHGAALNIVNDLADYEPILSCGLTLPVSRMADELPRQEFNLEGIAGQWFQFYRTRMEENFPEIKN